MKEKIILIFVFVMVVFLAFFSFFQNDKDFEKRKKENTKKLIKTVKKFEFVCGDDGYIYYKQYTHLNVIYLPYFKNSANGCAKMIRCENFVEKITE